MAVPAVRYRRKLWPLLPDNRVDMQMPPLNSAKPAIESVQDADQNLRNRSHSSSNESIDAFVNKIERELI